MASDFPAQQIHLIADALLPVLESRAAAVDRTPARPRLSSFPVPSGISYLTQPNESQPCLATIEPAPPAEWVMLEPVLTQRSRLRLLLIGSAAIRACVNGQMVTRVLALKEKDQLQLNSDWIFHVTIFNRPRVGYPAPDRVGQPCPICRVPLMATAASYTCGCGKAYHCDEKDTGGLECARLLGECACGRPVVLTEGFIYWPA